MERTRELIQRVRDEISTEELERLESLASRFARLADMLIQRVMRLVDEVELTPSGSVLDRIYRAEKRGWVNRADVLVRIRELRNHSWLRGSAPQPLARLCRACRPPGRAGLGITGQSPVTRRIG